jgi:SOS-response transcriptional repressor LexA
VAVPPNAVRGEETRAKILDFIGDYVRRHQFAPSLADIAAYLGYASPYGVQKHLARLASQGLVGQIPGGRRTVHLTEAGRAMAASHEPLSGASSLDQYEGRLPDGGTEVEPRRVT